MLALKNTHISLQSLLEWSERTRSYLSRLPSGQRHREAQRAIAAFNTSHARSLQILALSPLSQRSSEGTILEQADNTLRAHLEGNFSRYALNPSE